MTSCFRNVIALDPKTIHKRVQLTTLQFCNAHNHSAKNITLMNMYVLEMQTPHVL